MAKRARLLERVETLRPAPVKAPRARLKRPKEGLLLRDSTEDEGFTTLDLVNGLQAVCQALDETAGLVSNNEHTFRLAMAAKILSTMVADRVEI